VIGITAEAFRADDEHRRPRVDFLGRRAAQTRDQRTRVLAPERAEFSGKDDQLSCEWWTSRAVR
jgi:hypothetical protein